MDILEAVIADDLGPTVVGGLTLYPAHALGRIFDWTDQQGLTVEWIEGAFYNPVIDERRHSLSYMCDCDQSTDYASFRDTCLGLASAIQVEAAAASTTGYFEVGISD